MRKWSYNDKLCTLMLREQGHAKAIISSYPDKGWELRTVEKDTVESTALAQQFCVNQVV